MTFLAVASAYFWYQWLPSDPAKRKLAATGAIIATGAALAWGVTLLWV